MSTGPKVGLFRQAAGPWIGLIGAWALVALGALFWLAGGISSWLLGRGLTGPSFGFEFGRDLFAEGPSELWPDVPLGMIVAVFVLEIAALVVPVVILVTTALRGQQRVSSASDPAASLAIEKDLFNLTPDGVRLRALALRPSLDRQLVSTRDRKSFSLAEAGVPLGTLDRRGTELRASWEDVALAIMAPRSGKTTAQAVPAILDAPGAVVVTSNKADVWQATAALRRTTKGPVWVFDPQDITPVPQEWWWNPLKTVRTFDAALRLASHFMQEVKGPDDAGDDAFWTSSAADVLTCLFLAAGLSNQSLLRVYEWLNDPGNSEPVDILRQHGDDAAAYSLEARQTTAHETREGIFEFARTACRCLRNRDIVRWVVPPWTETGSAAPAPDVPWQGGTQQVDLQKAHRGLAEFDPSRFATSTETMYLLSKDGAAAAAPLVAALTDQIMVEATRRAEHEAKSGHGRGRLDPPMVVILDEAANICKIADLPLLYSHLGSRGIFVLTILQSRPQARQVWGREGFETMWSAATIKLIGAGIDDPELADDISRLVGEHDISIRSVSSGSSGEFSESLSLRKEAIMSPSAVRAMPKGRAILLATGSVPASIKLQPWFEGPHAKVITDAIPKAGDLSRWPDRGRPVADQLATPPGELVTASPRPSRDEAVRDGEPADGDRVTAMTRQTALAAPPEGSPATATAPQVVLISQDGRTLPEPGPAGDAHDPRRVRRLRPPRGRRP